MATTELLAEVKKAFYALIDLEIGWRDNHRVVEEDANTLAAHTSQFGDLRDELIANFTFAEGEERDFSSNARMLKAVEALKEAVEEPEKEPGKVVRDAATDAFRALGAMMKIMEDDEDEERREVAE